jgi:hypothetical protein
LRCSIISLLQFNKNRAQKRFSLFTERDAICQGSITGTLTGYWPSAPENLIGYLEAYGETLLRDRKLVAYLVAFRNADRDNRSVMQRMLRTERNFLIKEFRIDPSHIKTIDGGYRQSRTMELWLAQPGYRPIVTSYRVAR